MEVTSEEILELLWKIHARAFKEKNKLALDLATIAISLATRRQNDQLMIMLDSLGLIRYANDTDEFIMKDEYEP